MIFLLLSSEKLDLILCSLNKPEWIYKWHHFPSGCLVWEELISYRSKQICVCVLAQKCFGPMILVKRVQSWWGALISKASLPVRGMEAAQAVWDEPSSPSSISGGGADMGCVDMQNWVCVALPQKTTWYGCATQSYKPGKHLCLFLGEVLETRTPQRCNSKKTTFLPRSLTPWPLAGKQTGTLGWGIIHLHCRSCKTHPDLAGCYSGLSQVNDPQNSLYRASWVNQHTQFSFRLRFLLIRRIWGINGMPFSVP